MMTYKQKRRLHRRHEIFTNYMSSVALLVRCLDVAETTD